MRRLLDWEREAIVRAMADNEKRDALCAEFGVSRSYPGNLARRRGVEPRPTGRPSKRLQSEKTIVAIEP